MGFTDNADLDDSDFMKARRNYIAVSLFVYSLTYVHDFNQQVSFFNIPINVFRVEAAFVLAAIWAYALLRFHQLKNEYDGKGYRMMVFTISRKIMDDEARRIANEKAALLDTPFTANMTADCKHYGTSEDNIRYKIGVHMGEIITTESGHQDYEGGIIDVYFPLDFVDKSEKTGRLRGNIHSPHWTTVKLPHYLAGLIAITALFKFLIRAYLENN